MLSLDLDLEADLGIDTVKQAEMFAAVRETYHIPRDPDLKLRDFPTLQHVIQFVRDRRPREAASPEVCPTPEPQVEQISGAADRVTEAILEMVAGKTGYPKDMLSLDLDLEADLGIDTVKQAEMFAAVRETYHIPRDPDLKLRDFPTLQHVIQFVRDRRPREAASPEVCPTPEPQVGQTSGAAEDRVTEAVLEMVAAKTGYPKDMLDLDLDLEADLGIDTVKQAEMFASIRETYNIPRNPDLKPRDFPTLKHVIQFARDRSPKTEPAVLEAPAVLATPAEAPAAPAAESVGNTVLETLLDLVAEKTGYPKDMLDLDLDLEADLGVDTVKQAEIFASIRETYQIPRDPDLKLRDFPTLKHVLQFVRDRSPHQPGPAAEAPIPPVETAQASTPPDTVLDTVLDLVAEKTGYPKDMLDLDLDMEADLGIDTVKQAEMFASIRETYRIPRDPDLKLRDFPTLKHVLQFVQDRRPAVEAATPDAVPPSPPPAAPLLDLPFVSGRRPTVALAGFEAAERIPRRVPVPVLRPPLGLFKPTGVVLGRGTRVFLAPDRGGVAAALSEKLNALGVEVVSQDRLADGPIAGVYWLPALDDEGDLSAMTADRWRDAVDRRVKSLYRTMRSLYPQIAVPGTFLVSATRMGGRHGYDAAGAAEPLGGAVTGFTKAHKRERPDAMVKAVDFETALGPAEIADILIEETLRDPAMVEIGHAAGLRWTVGLDERAVEGDVPGMVLDGKTVFCVTGAAGSIVSAITADLASASGGTFHLLDLVPEPDPADPDLQRYETDREGLKRDLFARIQARGQRATPALVEKDLAALERAQAACRAIEAVRAAGGTAHYYSVDLTDAEAMAKVMGEVRRRSGRIDVLLHAAGIERSHMLPDKEPREFDTVFDVKAGGCFHLLRAIGNMPLRTIVLFSSIAGRFGNGGQTDYSAANDFLCKVASNFRRGHPEGRAIAIDWTAWGGIGMASRGSIPKVMEMAGIEMLSPEAGVPWIRRELTAGGSAAEVLAAGALGMFLSKTDAGGGLDGAGEPKGVMISGTVRNGPRGTLTFETTLDPAIQPFLRDHAIDGTPVLPGVMAVEAFAEAALSFAPGWSIKSIEDVEFLLPFKFYRNEPRSVFVEAEFHLQDGDLVARCRVLGKRLLFNQPDPQTTTHFTGSVRLVLEPAAGNGTSVAMALSEPAIEASAIYRTYFHGPAYRVLKRAWYGPDCAVGEMASGLPDHHYPAGHALALRPLWIELCFQTAGIWEMSVQHRMGLPRGFDRLLLYRAPGLVKGPVNAVVKPGQAGERFQAAVVDAAGDCFLQIEGYRTVTFRETVDVNALHVGEPVTA